MNRQDNQASAAFYAELIPLPRHRGLVDHLYLLHDDGRMTGPDRRVFSSPFHEINFFAPLAHCPQWRCRYTRPRFGARPRGRALRGWIIGIRFSPFSPLVQEWRAEVLDGLALRLEGALTPDALAWALDCILDDLAQDGHSATPPLWPEAERVGDLAAGLGVSARTAQRRLAIRTGLTPKRWLAVARFHRALRDVALSVDGLAGLAVERGYADQAHLSAEMVRHAGLSPGRLRRLARHGGAVQAVRFFQEPSLGSRLRLLITDPQQPGNSRDDLSAQRPQL